MKRAMGENNSYRAEQMKLLRLLRKSSPNDHFETEFPIWKDGRRVAVCDIINHTTKRIYRVNGESHDSKHSRLWDEQQRDILETMGFYIRDVPYWCNDFLWEK